MLGYLYVFGEEKRGKGRREEWSGEVVFVKAWTEASYNEGLQREKGASCFDLFAIFFFFGPLVLLVFFVSWAGLDRIQKNIDLMNDTTNLSLYLQPCACPNLLPLLASLPSLTPYFFFDVGLLMSECIERRLCNAHLSILGPRGG